MKSPLALVINLLASPITDLSTRSSGSSKVLRRGKGIQIVRLRPSLMKAPSRLAKIKVYRAPEILIILHKEKSSKVRTISPLLSYSIVSTLTLTATVLTKT